MRLYDPVAPKRATNLTVNSELLNAARECEINLSATLEAALIDEIKQSKKKRWLIENKESIAAYNKLVEKRGVFSDGSRSF